jgi:hypothetical protein
LETVRTLVYAYIIGLFTQYKLRLPSVAHELVRDRESTEIFIEHKTVP